MEEKTRSHYFSVLSNNDVGIEFPAPKPNPRTMTTFEKGDTVIVTTSCEDIALHELTGMVTSKNKTGSYTVLLDVDKTHLVFLPHEIGHHR